MMIPQATIFFSFSLAPINYGKKLNIIIEEPESMKLDKNRKAYIQKVIGRSLYYSHAIDMTILYALSKIASQQANLTKRTLLCFAKIFDYMATNLITKIWFQASDMILYIHLDACYLTAKGEHKA